MCIYLIIGVILFGLTHLYPVIFTNGRLAIIEKTGTGIYKGIFSLLIILSLVLIVIGWRITGDVDVYEPPIWASLATLILMYPMLFLFISARAGSNIKRLFRHPQLSSISLWGIAHLLSSGESRAIVLFGALAVWALVQMIFLNRRDGDWQKPDILPISRDIKVAIIALLAYVALAYGHGYFTGVILIAL